MEWLIENWPLIIAMAAVIAIAACYVYHFIKLPRSEQIARIQEWLLWAVAEAEKQLGGGTGQLKLRYVYDMFVSKFPIAAKFLSFTAFSALVDKALEKFEDLLKNNKQVEEYIEDKSPDIVVLE